MLYTFLNNIQPETYIRYFLLEKSINQTYLEDKEYIKNIKAVHEQGAFDSYYDTTERRRSQEVSIENPHHLSLLLCYIGLAKDQNLPDYLHWKSFQKRSCWCYPFSWIPTPKGAMTMTSILGFWSSSWKISSANGCWNLKFKPTYNPYTEPSMAFLARRFKVAWVEIVYPGMFRPEMLERVFQEVWKHLGLGLHLWKDQPWSNIKFQNIRELLVS